MHVAAQPQNNTLAANSTRTITPTYPLAAIPDFFLLPLLLNDILLLEQSR